MGAGYRMQQDRTRASAIAALDRLGPLDPEVAYADAEAEDAYAVRSAMRAACIGAVAIADGDQGLLKESLGLLTDIALRLGAMERKVRRGGR